MRAAPGDERFALGDDCMRECPAIEVDLLTGAPIVRVLDGVAVKRGYRRQLSGDNGPEFRCEALDQWAYQHCVLPAFTEPGRLVQNPAHRKASTGSSAMNA